MFDMRFEVRRRWCRSAFCLLCLVPTVCIMGAVAVTRSPVYRAAAHAAREAQLSDQLGLSFLAESFQRRGADWVVHAVELRDPETNQWVLRAASVEFSAAGRTKVVLVHHAELYAAQLPRVGQILHEYLLQRPSLSDRPILVSAATLTMRYEQQAESLSDVRCELSSCPEGSEAFAQFRLPGNVAREPAHLRLIRNRQIDPPTTAWELHTGDTPLPCSLATPWIEAAARLGAGSTFQGKLWAEQGQDDWTAELSGTFRHLQLERLVTSQFPHKLSGEGELKLKRMNVRRGRIIDLNGDLRARDGVVSRSLLTAARDELRLTLRDPMDDASLFRYKQLEVGFTLDNAGMVLVGSADPAAGMLCDEQGALLSGGGDVLSPLALLRMLVPQHHVHVPATQETASLVRMFPLPQSSTKSYGTVRLLD
jgi:hypothetical protein